MTAHWDELFLKLHNQQVLQEELELAEQDQEWMTFSVEEAIEGLSSGSLTLPDGQVIHFHTLQAFEDQLTLSIPRSLIPEVSAEQSSNSLGGVVVQDKANGIVLGLRSTNHELEQEQLESYLQQMIEHTTRKHSKMKLINHKFLLIQGTVIGCYESLFLLTPIPFYQIAFVRSWRGKAYIGSCQFKLEDASLWVPLTYAMLHHAVWSDNLDS
ncbi:hypothetical protein [Paenibacillus sp. IHBB 3054]|uniref:hypothetical protein n=1 Tax=Paenibacillus sp. IHBB 3054 TaxID=3425689 RepID=UPI003F6700F4